MVFDENCLNLDAVHQPFTGVIECVGAKDGRLS